MFNSCDTNADRRLRSLEHALVRCAQEIFTNSVRHAEARNLWLEVEEKGGRLDLSTAPGGGFTVTAWLPSGGKGAA